MPSLAAAVMPKHQETIYSILVSMCITSSEEVQHVDSSVNSLRDVCGLKDATSRLGQSIIGQEPSGHLKESSGTPSWQQQQY